ncbi:hypothetical protein ACLQ24_30225, partial [Micromonospora sp. DT4]|uniref:hypothetical protein n=1 Tax=Micromonospora sp. DT4 TaxID=3393438 RepID=UPI003CF63854
LENSDNVITDVTHVPNPDRPPLYLYRNHHQYLPLTLVPTQVNPTVTTDTPQHTLAESSSNDSYPHTWITTDHHNNPLPGLDDVLWAAGASQYPVHDGSEPDMLALPPSGPALPGDVQRGVEPPLRTESASEIHDGGDSQSAGGTASGFVQGRRSRLREFSV